MSQLPDLVQDSKLETQFRDGFMPNASASWRTDSNAESESLQAIQSEAVERSYQQRPWQSEVEQNCHDSSMLQSLRKPTEKFPEDPNPDREGVATLDRGEDIPPGARWTKLDRKLVDPEALEEAGERFEERLDCVVVLRILRPEEIRRLAERTAGLRGLGGELTQVPAPLGSADNVSEAVKRDWETASPKGMQFAVSAESDSDDSVSYHAPVQGDAESSQGQSWYRYYDFIAEVELGQSPYWRLKAEYTATEDYPMYKSCADSESKSRSAYLNICLEAGCKSMPFKREADLERHYQQMHWDSSAKPSFRCDYPKCSRSTNPLPRFDHYRDHCRDYHREDLFRRSSLGKETNEWWANRIIHKRWWRCSKCLHRVYIQQHGFECHNCKTPCESQRRNYRVHK
ncbi:hypothetical protein DL770_005535 [Monosporascus sp. CRB-9-2]|nr:hypothetical protein DL770_005535 [Monosporascus sp. CRB-9-2]